MNKKIEQVFAKVLELNQEELSNLSNDSSIHTVLRWDSLGHLALITALEEEFNVAITNLEAIKLINILEIKKLLINKGACLTE